MLPYMYSLFASETSNNVMRHKNANATNEKNGQNESNGINENNKYII